MIGTIFTVIFGPTSSASGSSGGGTPATAVITEGSDPIVTEAGDFVVTE